MIDVEWLAARTDTPFDDDDEPQKGEAKRMRRSRLSALSLSALALLTATMLSGAQAHSGSSDEQQQTFADGREPTYAEIHMAEGSGRSRSLSLSRLVADGRVPEHHLDNFDLQSFFHLHDLNRDVRFISLQSHYESRELIGDNAQGVLDINELESIYGVHHEKVKKATGGTQEVHTEQARRIVAEVLDRLDANRDAVLTMREFLAGGVGGLPMFDNVPNLGHHYDEEGEYFLHHEEKYHNTPETQREEDYVHPEDIEHFLRHDKIDDEEDRRQLEYTGEEPHPDEAAAPPPPPPPPPAARQNSAPRQAQAQQRQPGPGAQRQNANTANRFNNPRNPGSNPRAKADNAAAKERAAFARDQAARFDAAARDAQNRGQWTSFAKPRDDIDRLRKSVPYKYKVKAKSRWSL